MGRLRRRTHDGRRLRPGRLHRARRPAHAALPCGEPARRRPERQRDDRDLGEPEPGVPRGGLPPTAGRADSERRSLDDAVLTGADTALDGVGMRAGTLALGFAVPPEGAVDLQCAQSTTLYDPEESRPREIRLDGFGYAPQPYEQLAAHYRQAGHDDAARRVLLEKQRHRRRTPGSPRCGRSSSVCSALLSSAPVHRPRRNPAKASPSTPSSVVAGVSRTLSGVRLRPASDTCVHSQRPNRPLG